MKKYYLNNLKVYFLKREKVDFSFLNKNDNYIENTTKVMGLYNFNKNAIKHTDSLDNYYLDLINLWAY